MDMAANPGIVAFPFELALQREQDREAELFGAGR